MHFTITVKFCANGEDRVEIQKQGPLTDHISDR